MTRTTLGDFGAGGQSSLTPTDDREREPEPAIRRVAPRPAIRRVEDGASPGCPECVANSATLVIETWAADMADDVFRCPACGTASTRTGEVV